MVAIEVSEFGEPEVLHITEKELPELKADQVQIQVEAIGVNPVDTYIRAGSYPLLPELPYTPGANVSGYIEQLGPGVTAFEVGDKVYSSSTRYGAYAERAVCHISETHRLSDKLSFAQGAALGTPAATAWRGLFIRGEAKPGERLLVHGASGAVGQAALQLVKSQGLDLFGTAGTDSGCRLIEQLGAKAFRHDTSDYVDELEQALAGKGVDLVLEMLANKNLETDLQLLAPGGRVVIIGSRGRIEIDPRATMGKETEIRGLALQNTTEAELHKTHSGISDAVERGDLFPSISAEFPLSSAAKAHRLVMQDGNCGKIVLIPTNPR